MNTPDDPIIGKIIHPFKDQALKPSTHRAYIVTREPKNQWAQFDIFIGSVPNHRATVVNEMERDMRDPTIVSGGDCGIVAASDGTHELHIESYSTHYGSTPYRLQLVFAARLAEVLSQDHVPIVAVVIRDTPEEIRLNLAEHWRGIPYADYPGSA